MPGCVLRVSGPYEELTHALRTVPLDFTESIRAGRRRERGDGRTTYNSTVSDADGDQIPVQIADAEAFLREHDEPLRDLVRLDAVESAQLDFGWDLPVGALGQWNEFPASLLRTCGELGVDIVVSVYAVSGGK